MSKYPSLSSVPIDVLVHEYHATYLREALARYVVVTNHPNWTARQVEEAAFNTFLPFRKLPVFHKVKFVSKVDEELVVVDSIHANCARKKRGKSTVPARFDTALVRIGECGEIGVQGYQVVQVRVIFKFPDSAIKHLFHSNQLPAQHLAYIEWFSPFPRTPAPSHRLYKLTRSIRNGERIASILPIQSFRRSVHLIPQFGPSVPRNWTSETARRVSEVFRELV